jgi:hypothetical protein
MGRTETESLSIIRCLATSLGQPSESSRAGASAGVYEDTCFPPCNIFPVRFIRHISLALLNQNPYAFLCNAAER